MGYNDRKIGDNMEDKVIGIIGGMGPEATIDIFNRIVKYTRIHNEEDHLRILIDNNPKMPSRQMAILEGGKSPLSNLIEMAKGLQNNGADVLIMAANTPHYYYDAIKKEIEIPFLNMVDETVLAIKRQFVNVKKVGLLATKAILKTKLYQLALEKENISMITLNSLQQDTLQEAIMEYKNTGDLDLFKDRVTLFVEILLQEGVEVIILGCTELPLVLENKDAQPKYIDPNDIIAKAAVRFAKGVKED